MPHPQPYWHPHRPSTRLQNSRTPCFKLGRTAVAHHNLSSSTSAMGCCAESPVVSCDHNVSRAVWNDAVGQEGSHSCFLLVGTLATWDAANDDAGTMAAGVHLLTSTLVSR